MSGFYVEHLKNPRAKEFALQLEKRFFNPTMDVGMNTVISFNTTNKDDLYNVLHAGYAVLYDHPELFYYRINLNATWDGSVVTLEMPLLYTIAEIKTLRNRLNKRIEEIISKIPPNSSNYQKERYLFEYLQTNVDYVSDDNNMRHSIVGPLLCNKAVCEGISKAFAVLCHRVGINCILASSTTHMWNVVSLDGIITNVDATYATARDGHRCDYRYFNFSDNKAGKDHVKEIDCMPACTDYSYNPFRFLF